MTSRIALMLVIVAVLVASHRGTSSSQQGGEHLRVIDGDTLQVDGKVVQLYGIDTPELGQLCETGGSLWHCGMEAAFALRKLVTVNQASLQCSPWGDGGGGVRDLAPATTAQVCKVGSEDLAVVMLHNGHSVALPGTFPDYVEAERQARDAGLGLWQSDFVLPWDWRAGVRAAGRPSDVTRECNVKRALGAAGQRFYYVPTDEEYRAITIDPSRGEAVFCSDDEARLAGWRRAGETAGVDE